MHGFIKTQRRNWLRWAGLIVSDDQVELENGTVLTGGGSPGGAAERLSNPTLTAPDDLQDGDTWVEASGESPARSIALKVRDNGVTYTLAEIIR